MLASYNSSAGVNCKGIDFELDIPICWNLVGSPLFSMHPGGGEQGDGGCEGGAKGVGTDSAVEACGAPPQGGRHPEGAQDPDR